MELTQEMRDAGQKLGSHTYRGACFCGSVQFTVSGTPAAEFIGEYHKTANSHRKWCEKCGGHLFTEHPGWRLIDVYAASIPGFPYLPGVHVNYQETKLRVKDGLPKLKDLPKEMGGSGVGVPE